MLLLLLLTTTVRRRTQKQAPLARRRWNGRYGAIFRKDEIVRRRDARSRIATDDVLLQAAPARRRLLATAALRLGAGDAGQALLRRKTRHGGRWSLSSGYEIRVFSHRLILLFLLKTRGRGLSSPAGFLPPGGAGSRGSRGFYRRRRRGIFHLRTENPPPATHFIGATSEGTKKTNYQLMHVRDSVCLKVFNINKLRFLMLTPLL